MGKILNELIEYNGIDSCEHDSMVNFKQFIINGDIYVPIEKTDIQNISKVWIDYNILKAEFVKTPYGKSVEGQVLTGNAAYVSANLNIKLEYIGYEGNNRIYSMYETIPICVYVTLKDEVNSCSSICPYLLIEDIYCKKVNCRKVYLNVTLTAIVDT